MLTEDKPLYSILSEDARSKALSVKNRRSSGQRDRARRNSVFGSMDGFLSEHRRLEEKDDESFCSHQSDHSKLSAATTGRLYLNRGSIPKHSLDSTMRSESTVGLEEDELSFASFKTSGRSCLSASSFPEIPSECTTIDDLPLPMKKKLGSQVKERSSGRSHSKSNDTISKYANEPLLDSSERRKKDPASPSKGESESGKVSKSEKKHKSKKSKSDKKHRSDRKSRSDRHSEETEFDSETPKRRHQRRCSVTKYNLGEQDKGKESTPASPGRLKSRRNSVTKYSPDMEDCLDSPGRYSRRNSVTKYSPEMSDEMRPDSLAVTA